MQPPPSRCCCRYALHHARAMTVCRTPQFTAERSRGPMRRPARVGVRRVQARICWACYAGVSTVGFGELMLPRSETDDSVGLEPVLPEGLIVRELQPVFAVTFPQPSPPASSRMSWRSTAPHRHARGVTRSRVSSSARRSVVNTSGVDGMRHRTLYKSSSGSCRPAAT